MTVYAGDVSPGSVEEGVEEGVEGGGVQGEPATVDSPHPATR